MCHHVFPSDIGHLLCKLIISQYLKLNSTNHHPYDCIQSVYILTSCSATWMLFQILVTAIALIVIILDVLTHICIQCDTLGLCNYSSSVINCNKIWLHAFDMIYLACMEHVIFDMCHVNHCDNSCIHMYIHSL